MSTKRKWDQAAPEVESEVPSKATKTEETKTASEAAATAAAIAAKIAAQFANGGTGGGGKDPYDGEFTHDIDINDLRNRYLLTRGSTQQQIHEETGASVSTKGTWYPDRSKATDRDPPLYLHIAANTPEVLQNAIEKVKELIDMDLGSLVEDKKDRQRERRKWPEEKLPVGLESIRNFNVRAKVVGPSGVFVKYIQQETQTRVQIKGTGSGFVDQETGREADEPMYIHVTGPDEQQVARAKALTEDLLEVVHAEHAKVKAVVQQQQMELHQAQLQYAAYNAYAQNPYSGAVPPPPDDAPPPPPGEAPPQPAAPQQLQSTDPEAYAQYWAQYGYDVNSADFKKWQEQAYAQYYQQGGGQTPGQPATQPPGQPQPPTSAPPPPPSDAAPPPPPPA